jgi:shikimate dehydrogenase
MQNAALEALGLAGTWSYEAIDVAPDEFEAMVRGMPAQGFAGANVTVPHKLAALALADEVTPAARAIGAANTLTFAGGAIAAENTDAPGLIEALPQPAKGARALVMGAGGSARAAIWALVEGGADVSIWNRTARKAERLADELGASVAAGDAGSLEVGDFDLVVNATTVGLARASGEDGPALKALPIAADALGARHVVVDLVYGSAETDLVRTARQRGASVVDGLEVLVHQGAASLRIWTGEDPPIETMRQAALKG